MSLTNDPTDPRLGHGSNDEPTEQNDAYLVLSDEERAKGFVRGGHHDGAGDRRDLRPPARLLRRDCVGCRMHRPVGEHGEFVWDGPYDPTTGVYSTPKVGT